MTEAIPVLHMAFDLTNIILKPDIQRTYPMNAETYQFYRHSGKFSPHGLALALIVPIAVGFPLGYVYAYLIKWIPFIYLNVFITAGYGGVVGFLAGWMLKFGKVRNNVLAVLCGLLAGISGLYLGWNGHIHAYFEDSPAFCLPAEILRGMKYLYEHGSWTLKGETITGVILAIVWGVEALMIIGLSTLVSYVMISGTPFCERTESWLDQEKKISTLEPFTQPAQLESFKAGDLSSLFQARAKSEGASTFGRLTIKHSPKCEEFFTVTVANVTVAIDKKGKITEKSRELARNVIVSKSMFDRITKLEELKPEPPVTA
jgi:hypothetical protein